VEPAVKALAEVMSVTILKQRRLERFPGHLSRGGGVCHAFSNFEPHPFQFGDPGFSGTGVKGSAGFFGVDKAWVSPLTRC
jgi:hypothetical protein